MENQERRLIGRGALLGGAVVAGSLFFKSGPVLWGAVAGSLVGLGNLYVIIRLVRGFLAHGGPSRGRLIALFLLKTLGLFAIIGLILLKTDANGLAFAAGLTAVVLALTWEGLMGAPRTPPPLSGGGRER